MRYRARSQKIEGQKFKTQMKRITTITMETRPSTPTGVALNHLDRCLQTPWE